MTTLPRIHVSANKRFLVTENGAPLFWLGDTAWALFHRLMREETTHYFNVRQAQRFTVTLDVFCGETIIAWWYAPRSGEAMRIGAFSAGGERTFSPPGCHPDWVLVLDDAARGFAAPGSA